MQEGALWLSLCVYQMAKNAVPEQKKTKKQSHHLCVSGAFVCAEVDISSLYIYLSSQPRLPPREVCQCSQCCASHQMPSSNRDWRATYGMWPLLYLIIGVKLRSKKGFLSSGQQRAVSRGLTCCIEVSSRRTCSQDWSGHQVSRLFKLISSLLWFQSHVIPYLLMFISSVARELYHYPTNYWTNPRFKGVDTRPKTREEYFNCKNIAI